MITLHRKSDDPVAAKIEEKLKDMVVAYRTEEYDERKPSQPTPEENLPFISENGHIVSGLEDIQAYLNQLSVELNQQRQVTGDGCYLDPDTGDVC